ncbi:hypothetical protein AB7C87_07740 [Natrarchaeobius sp. A-rgal3]|uniref:hypothetical protein n=1 Tax=Natrarchaeobius versutus TaxID=1679078 RepID=UPI00350F1535
MEIAIDLGIEPSVVEDALDGLKQEGMVYEPEPGQIRVTHFETSQNQSPAQGQSSSVDLTRLEDRTIKPEIPEIPGEGEVRCSLCGAVRAEEEVKITVVRGNTRHFSRGGCDKEDDTGESDDKESIAKGMVVERVECNGCGKMVVKSEATEKDRINDRATVWYCNDC